MRPNLEPQPRTSIPADECGPAAEPRCACVSVVVTCFNQGRYLNEAIASVRGQSYRDFELIVVDDGSTDETGEVARSHPEARYVRQSNQGLAAARNRGLRECTGSYVAFLDADDRLRPGALEAGVRQLRSHPGCAFVSGRHRIISADGVPFYEAGLPHPGRDAYLALLRGNYIGMHAAVLYRSDVLRSIGGFDVTLPVCEDYDVFLRIARNWPVGWHPEFVADYRRHDGNMSADRELMLATALVVLKRQWEHVKQHRRYRRAYQQGHRRWQEHFAFEAPFLDASRDGRGTLAAVLDVARRASPLWLARRAVRHLGETIAWRVRSLADAAIRRWFVGRPCPFVWPPRGRVDFGQLRRLRPISRYFGYGRGLPIDRYYVEGFLARHRRDVRGHVLEVGDNVYTVRFGGERVIKSDVLDVDGRNPQSTLVGDLTDARHLPPDAFDCVILTQTLHLIFDLRAAIRTIHRILKPGGVLLATVPGVSQIDRGRWRDQWYWSFSERSARRSFEEAFPPDGLIVEGHGNVLAAIAFLHGLATKELRPAELDHHDPHYQILIAIRAVKPTPVGEQSS